MKVVRLPRKLPIVLATLATLCAVYVMPATASASIGVCRSDPVIVLSNLKVLDLSAMISDSTSDLKSVTYTLHAPKGTAALLVVPTDGLVGQVEHFVFRADNPSNHYTVTTYVNTGTRVAVTASILNLLGASGNATGYSNQNLTFSF
jgi:hypothetical protein